MQIDYSDPRQRTYKIPMRGSVGGYSFKRLYAWSKKWEDPLHKIRLSYPYRKKYIENYGILVHLTSDQQEAYILDGLEQCVNLFKNIKNDMEPTEQYYKNFVFEAKCLFFAYFDFCKPKIKEVSGK